MNPWVKNPQALINPGPFHEGDTVTFNFGGTEVPGLIVEDRGNLGVGGRRLYGVKFPLDDVSEPLYIELPAEELKLVPAPPQTKQDGKAE